MALLLFMICLVSYLLFKPDYTPTSPKNGRVDEIAVWLDTNLEKGDLVQPLDWVEGGSIHAMLLANAKLATKYMYDYHFYHHISRDYIQKLRDDFIEELKKSNPRYLISIIEPIKTWPWK